MYPACLAKNEVVIGGERNTRLSRQLRDRRSDMKVDRLNHDRIDALRDDVFSFGDLVLRVVLSGLDDDRITIGLRRFPKERHIGVQVPERRLLFEHEGDFLVGLFPAVQAYRRPLPTPLPATPRHITQRTSAVMPGHEICCHRFPPKNRD